MSPPDGAGQQFDGLLYGKVTRAARRLAPERCDSHPWTQSRQQREGLSREPTSFILVYETARCQYASITACRLETVQRLTTADFGTRGARTAALFARPSSTIR